MCGIAGWSLKNPMPQAGVITLSALMQDRGEHSWGWYDVTVDKLEKNTGPILTSPMLRNFSTREGFIHTRHATHGTHTVANAHPFRIGNIVGAHNGVLSNHCELNQQFDRNFDVDSQHIFAHLNEARDFSSIEGYGALEWYDTEKQLLFLCKFGDAPLHVGTCSGGLIWASTQDAVRFAAIQAGFSGLNFYKVANTQVYSVVAGELIRENWKLAPRPNTSKLLPAHYQPKGYSVRSGGDKDSPYYWEGDGYSWEKSRQDEDRCEWCGRECEETFDIEGVECCTACTIQILREDEEHKKGTTKCAKA